MPTTRATRLAAACVSDSMRAHRTPTARFADLIQYSSHRPAAAENGTERGLTTPSVCSNGEFEKNTPEAAASQTNRRVGSAELEGANRFLAAPSAGARQRAYGVVIRARAEAPGTRKKAYMVAVTPPSAPPMHEPAADRPARAGGKLIGRLADNLSITVLLVVLILAGLPVVVWLDLRNLSEQSLREQADDLSSMINHIRDYYAGNVVGRVLAGGERTQVLPNYSAVPGAIPIPATLSLELGDVLNRDKGNVRFRFFSDYPFKNRAPHAFDAFEREALEGLRRDPNT